MEIVVVDRWLLQLASVDEDESEAVAASCVEFLLSETNAYYQQYCLAREAVRSVSSQLRDNVLDTVFAASLGAEQPLDNDRFLPESRPEAETKDRHAVRSVPSKSPEKPTSTINFLPAKASSSPASHAGSIPDKLRSPVRRKKQIGKDTSTATIPPVQIIERGEEDDEKPEIKAWREKCLKSLAASTKKPGFSKLVALARAFLVPEPRVTMEVGVISTPPENVVDAIAATPIETKTNVDAFSSICDPADGSEERSSVNYNGEVAMTSRRFSPSGVLESTGRNMQLIPTSIAENPRQPKRKSKSASGDVSLQQRQQRKTTLLTDSLSRRKSTRRPSTSESLVGAIVNNGWGNSSNLWQEAGSTTSRTFVAEGAEFNATAFADTMNVVPGVILSQGEAVVEGPDWVENATTMSRKRFDLHQRLATDAALNSPSERDLFSPQSLNLGSPLQFGHYPVSPLSELHFRDYEEVPAEPIVIPPLSSISTSTLGIPRTHLTMSLSTPSLRVRPLAASGKAGGTLNHSTTDEGSNRSICTNSSINSLEKLKIRPSTALRGISDRPRLVEGRARASSATPGNARLPQARSSQKSKGPASAKYLREFPRPRSGVVRVMNDQAVSLLGTGDDRQRTAWMS